MKQVQRYLALLCVSLVCAPGMEAQNPPQRQEDTSPAPIARGGPWYTLFTRDYQPREVPPVDLQNSGRLDSLLRGGNLYLSLRDAVALAIENNLDVELQRYEFGFADADLLRAQAGSSTLGIPTNVTTGMPTGATGTLGNLNTGLASGGATSVLAPGDSLDPMVGGLVQWGHITALSQNTVTTGVPDTISTNRTANFNISQSFLTGGTATLSYNNLVSAQNNYLNLLNPTTTSYLDLSISQPLLQGFGIAMNRRPIVIARNNIKAADLVFKQQLINVVANISSLYWNLVYFNNDLDVKRRSVASSTKLLNDNKAQVDVGTLAPISIVQAEAQLASDEQAVVQSETNVLQQETLLKSALSRNGLASPSVSSARVICTDRIRIPEAEAIDPLPDLVTRALDKRPELAQSHIQIENQKLNLKGIRNQMLPSVNLIADLRNNALSGALNDTPNPFTGVVPVHAADPFLLGGYGNVLSQIFFRNFPNYTVGVSLNIPLRNRAAQANMITNELNLRQNELSLQKLVNQIRVDVQSGVTAVLQARAQYQAAVKARILQEQTESAEEKKLAVGASTPYNVILMQRDMWAAQDAEVQAQVTYILARVQLDWATGMTLEKNDVRIEEARSSLVSRPPDVPPGN